MELNYAKIADLGGSGAYGGTRELDGLTCAFLLSLLALWPSYSFVWEDSDTNWDEIENMVAYAIDQIFTENGGGTGLITGTIHWAVFEWPYKPDGFLNCNGAEYLQADYPLLMAVIAPVYKTDATHFVVPDLRGRVPIGWGAGPGLSSYSTGDEGGTESELIEDFMLPPHTHPVIQRRNNAGWGGTGLATGTTSAAADKVTGENETLHKRIANIQPYHAIQPYIYTDDRP